MFRYELQFKSDDTYQPDVKAIIEVAIKTGLTTEDYEVLRDALKVVEDTARKYLPGALSQENKS